MLPPEGAFVLRHRVREEELDLQGRVNNVVFVQWLNDAAIHHSFAVGLDLHAYMRLGAMWVVRRHEVDYDGPARLGDELEFHTWLDFCRAASAHRQHLIRRVADGAVIARATNHWAWVGAADGRPKRIPAEVERAFGVLSSPPGWRRRVALREPAR